MNQRTALLLLALASTAFAQTLFVTTTVDTVDPADGVFSLREAIIAANARVDSTGQCLGLTNIHFSIPRTNATATFGSDEVPYYKIKINYEDPDYAKAMNFSPRPTTLPHVRCPINLDGYTQSGAKPGSPLIEISGEDLPLAFAATPDSLRGDDVERTTELLSLDGRLPRQLADGPALVGCRPVDEGCPLRRSASGSTIRGIMFNHSPQEGLTLFGADNVTITGNYFGLDATGENPAPNGRRTQDIRLFSLLLNGASGNTIGTRHERNYFGVARSHSMMLWPLTGGPGPCGATVPANTACGRYDIGSSDNVIQSNYFGLNKAGTRSLGAICTLLSADRRFIGEAGCAEGRTRSSAIYTNGGPHIFILFHPTGVPVSANSMLRNRIGGSMPREGNVFAAAWAGVQLRAAGTEVVGNIFGLDAEGESAAEIAPFFRMGVIVSTDSTGTLIENNIVANSANYGNLNIEAATYNYGGGIHTLGGLVVTGLSDDLSPNIIRGNIIGPNAKKHHPGLNLIGVPATNAGGGVTSTWMLPTVIEVNLIAFNGYLGVAPVTARNFAANLNTPNEQILPPRRLAVLGNSMYCNGSVAEGDTCGSGLGIDWSAAKAGLPVPSIGDGPTLNDDGDQDDGPASLQNFPVLAAVRGGVNGRLSSEPNTTYRIQLFSSPEDAGTCIEITATLQPGFTPDAACAKIKSAPAFFAIQGQTLIREIDVVTGADGVAEFSLTAPSNRLVAATATKLNDEGQPQSTSELSQAVSTRLP